MAITIISVLLILGLALLAWCIQSIVRGRQSRTWPAVPGRLLECRMESDGDGEMPSMRVRVRYAYEAKGRNFEGTRVAFGYCRGTLPEEHQELYDKLRGASQVRVHYQPGRPDRAVLVTGAHRLAFVALGFAIIWVSIMSVVACGWFLHSRQII